MQRQNAAVAEQCLQKADRGNAGDRGRNRGVTLAGVGAHLNGVERPHEHGRVLAVRHLARVSDLQESGESGGESEPCRSAGTQQQQQQGEDGCGGGLRLTCPKTCASAEQPILWCPPPRSTSRTVLTPAALKSGVTVRVTSGHAAYREMTRVPAWKTMDGR